ncbi:MAG: SDR family NAD(P)-dependent oxidoreductase, partial [Mycobacterium sp.]
MSLRGLPGQVVIVAGGATGIGAATAIRLGSEGCRVVVGDIAATAAQRTAAAIVAAGGEAVSTEFDLAEPESVAALVEFAVSTHGGVDAIFNVGADMAALPADTDVVDIDLDVWDRVMAVNLRGYVACMKHAIPQIVSRG